MVSFLRICLYYDANLRSDPHRYFIGYSNITNIDVSRVVVDQMIDRYKDKPTLQWQQMNVTTLDFPDETFDCVVAKGKLPSMNLFQQTNVLILYYYFDF